MPQSTGVYVDMSAYPYNCVPGKANREYINGCIDRALLEETTPTGGLTLYWRHAHNWYFDDRPIGQRVIHLKGDGPEATTLNRGTANQDAGLTFGTGIVSGYGGGMSDLTYDGLARVYGATGPAIRINGRQGVSFDNVKFTDIGASVWHLTGGQSGNLWGSMETSKCFVTNSWGHSVHLDRYVVKTRMSGGQLAGAGRDNTGAIKNEEACGVYSFHGISELELAGVSIDSPAGHAVQAEYCSNFRILGGQALGPGRCAVYLGGGSGLVGHSHKVIGLDVESPSYAGNGLWDAFYVGDRGCRFEGITVRLAASGSRGRSAWIVREGPYADRNRFGITVTPQPEGGLPTQGFWLKRGAESKFTDCLPEVA